MKEQHHITTKPIYLKDILSNKIIKIDLNKKTNQTRNIKK